MLTGQAVYYPRRRVRLARTDRSRECVVDTEQLARLDVLQQDPYEAYARARRTPGLTFVAELNAWLLSRQADALEVLRRPDDFSSGNALLPDVPPSPAVL